MQRTKLGGAGKTKRTVTRLTRPKVPGMEACSREACRKRVNFPSRSPHKPWELESRGAEKGWELEGPSNVGDQWGGRAPPWPQHRQKPVSPGAGRKTGTGLLEKLSHRGCGLGDSSREEAPHKVRWRSAHEMERAQPLLLLSQYTSSQPCIVHVRDERILLCRLWAAPDGYWQGCGGVGVWSLSRASPTLELAGITRGASSTSRADEIA